MKNNTSKLHYENNLMLAVDGTPLATIGNDKVEWYTSRDLATIVDYPDKRYAQVIQLKFDNRGRGDTHPSNWQYVENQCVVCGRTDELAAHHVIPYRVKRFYKAKDKEHTKQQLVLLCREHHKTADALTEEIDNPHHKFTEWMQAVSRVVIKSLAPLRHIYIRVWLWRQGGIKGLNQAYINVFLKMEPKYLPEGWLNQDIPVDKSPKSPSIEQPNP